MREIIHSIYSLVFSAPHHFRVDVDGQLHQSIFLISVNMSLSEQYLFITTVYIHCRESFKIISLIYLLDPSFTLTGQRCHDSTLKYLTVIKHTTLSSPASQVIQSLLTLGQRKFSSLTGQSKNTVIWFSNKRCRS